MIVTRAITLPILRALLRFAMTFVIASLLLAKAFMPRSLRRAPLNAVEYFASLVTAYRAAESQPSRQGGRVTTNMMLLKRV